MCVCGWKVFNEVQNALLHVIYERTEKGKRELLKVYFLYFFHILFPLGRTCKLLCTFNVDASVLKMSGKKFFNLI